MEFRTGNGAAWLDLLQSLSGRYREVQTDAIDGPASLRAWLRQNHLEPTGAVTPDDVTRTIRARESLHRLAVAAVRQVAPSAADVRLLNELLAADPGVQVSGRVGGLKVRRPTSVDAALARLGRAAVVDLSGDGAGTLRACGDDTCAGIFLDTTGRRRWCSDQSCGNRLRVQRHRASARAGADRP